MISPSCHIKDPRVHCVTSNNISNNFTQIISLVYSIHNNRIKHESFLIVIEWTTRNDIDVMSDNMFNDDFDDLVINDENFLDAYQVLQPVKIIYDVQSKCCNVTGHICNTEEF